ncbi:MAG: glycosyltransferase [Calditrichia bacterium]
MEKNKPIIIQVVDSLLLGGAEKIAVELSEGFLRKGYEVHIIIHEDKITLAPPQGAHLHILSEKRNITGIKFIDRTILAKKLKRIVNLIGHGTSVPPLIISHLSRSHLLCKMAGFKNVLYVFHSTISRSIQNRKKNAIKQFLAGLQVKNLYKRQLLVAVSNGVKDDLVINFGFSEKQVRTIYNPFNFEKIRRLSDEVPDIDQPFPEKYLVSVARIKPEKRHDLMLDILSKLPEDIYLVLVGKEQEPLKSQLQQKAELLGISHRIIWLGQVDNPYPILKQAEALILTSDYEGFGNVLVEALCLGIPAISFDCPSGPSEILTGSLSHFLIPHGDVAGFVERIKSVLTEKPVIDLSEIERFSVEQITEQYLDLYENNLPEPRASVYCCRYGRIDF